VSASWTLLSFLLASTGSIPLSTAQYAYFNSLAPLDYLGSLAIGLVTLAAAIQLFRLRRNSVGLFSVALALNVVTTMVHATSRNWATALGTPGLVGVGIGWVILGTVVTYSYRLRERGVLS
jgi:hypothetical protein